MRIIVQDYPGHPFQVQLSRELARRGHEVLHIYAGYNQTPRGDLITRRDDPVTFSVRPVYIHQPLDKYSLIKRWFQEREYGTLVQKEIKAFRPDVVISANTPLDAQAIILKECHRYRIKFIFWVQDIIGIAVQRILKAKFHLLGLIIGEHYKRLERKLLRNSNNIVIISPDFQPLLLNWGINHHKINIIPNWAPLEIISDRPKGNSWAEQMGVADKFCFLYSGTLGMKHNPELLLRLALFFKESLDTCVVVISEGPGANWLIEQREIHKLDNLLVLPFQPMEQYADVLASGDVLVTILEPDAGIFSVPSKVLSYLCAKRPQLLAVPEENLAAKIVLNNEAGIVVNPLHKTAFLEAAKILYGHPSKRLFFAENGYLYAKNNFNIEKIGDSFERIILEAH